MSIIFYDHLLELTEIDRLIKKTSKSSDEREELWKIIDEIVHHKVMGCILDNLPRGDHEEFLKLFHKSPYDTALIFDYLKHRVGHNIEELIKKEIDKLSTDLLADLKKDILGLN